MVIVYASIFRESITLQQIKIVTEILNYVQVFNGENIESAIPVEDRLKYLLLNLILFYTMNVIFTRIGRLKHFFKLTILSRDKGIRKN